MTKPLDNVLRWEPLIDQHGAGLPKGAILALIDVESKGLPTARRAGSQFWGLTQIGAAMADDAGIADKTKPRVEWASPARDPDVAIRVTCAQLRRYRARWTDHGLIPDETGIAILWKGGPGTLRAVARAVVAGATLDDALKAQEKTIPRLRLYVERFLVAWRLYNDR
jgi:soluble lytic murein transglycosylase-like protein